MATWNIGIDETGTFDCFSGPNPNSPSFVCAVITRKDECDCENYLQFCAQNVEPTLYNSLADQSDKVPLKSVIEKFFHARVVDDLALLNDVMTYVRNSVSRNVFFEKLFVSQENTDFVGNPQNYYLNSLYEVLSTIFESKLFTKNDVVNVFIAQRASEVTGYDAPAEIIVDQLYGRYSLLKKMNPSDPELRKINDAIHVIFQYGYKTTETVVASTLKNRWMQNPTEAFLKRNKLYMNRLNQYHNKLICSIQKFLNQSYPGYNIYVKSQSANNSIFPAMADIAGTLVKNYGVESIKAKKRNLIRGYNIRAFIEEGDFSGAAKLIGELFYDGILNAKSYLVELFKSIDEKLRDELWKILIEICIKKMRERGIDGDSVLVTGNLINVLDSLVELYHPSRIVLALYLKMKGEYAAHSGSIDLPTEMKSLSIIESYINSCKDAAEYEILSNLYHDYLIEHVAQVQFNSYAFHAEKFYKILEDYRLKMLSNPFYTKKNVNGIPVCDSDFIDNRYSVICGTIGQMHAFSGEHDKAIEFFIKDYNHTSFMKFLPASFLVVEYLHKEDLKNAIMWFEIQVENVTGEKVEIKQFSSMAKDVEKTDMWLVLNYLRLWALSMKLKIPIVEEKFSFKEWIGLDYGDYPWSLVLKWAAVCNSLAGGAKAVSIALLKKSVEVLTELYSPTFSNKSLALSPVRILNILDKKNNFNYRQMYDSLCDKCDSFKLYANTNQKLNPEYQISDIWEAAMILPFNYS